MEPPICIGRDRDQLMADGVHIGSFCAQASRRGCFGRLRIADVNAATIRRTYDCVSRLTAGWSLTLAVLAAQIRSSLAPPSGSCSACGDLLVDNASGRHGLRVRIHQPRPVRARLPGPIRRNPVDDPPPAHAVALAGAAADQLARGLANARRVTAKVLCRGAAQATVTRPCPPALVAGALGS